MGRKHEHPSSRGYQATKSHFQLRLYSTLPPPFLPINHDLVKTFHVTNIVVPARKPRFRLGTATDRAHDSPAVVQALAVYGSDVAINVLLRRGGDLAALLWAGETAVGLVMGRAAFMIYVSPANQ